MKRIIILCLSLLIFISPAYGEEAITTEACIVMILNHLGLETSLEQGININLLSDHPGDGLYQKLNESIREEDFARLLYNTYKINHKITCQDRYIFNIDPINREGVHGLIELGVYEKKDDYKGYLSQEEAEVYLNRLFDPSLRLVTYKALKGYYFGPDDEDIYRLLDTYGDDNNLNLKGDDFTLSISEDWTLEVSCYSDWIKLINNNRSIDTNDKLDHILKDIFSSEGEWVWLKYTRLVQEAIRDNKILELRFNTYNRAVVIKVNSSSSELLIHRVNQNET